MILSIWPWETLERARFEEFGVENGLQGPPRKLDIIGFLSSLYPTPLLAESNGIKSSFGLTGRKTCILHLIAIDSMARINDPLDIEEAVEYCRLLLSSLQQGQCPKYGRVMTHLLIVLLGFFLHHAYHVTNNPEYLDESIDVYRNLLKIRPAPWFHFEAVTGLAASLFSRLPLSQDMQDFADIMELFPIARTDSFAKIQDRFTFSCRWAYWARAFGHRSTSAAYECAISLLQDLLVFTPTLEIQHFRLVAMRDDIEKLPLAHVSHQIHIGQFKGAIETLELGRGLLWSEMRGLRTSVDHLRIANSFLAEKFAAVNQDLEELMTSGPLIVWSREKDVGGDNEMDPFGRAVIKRQKLWNERNSLIIQIRSIRGLDDFFTAPSFDILRSAATHGPVVIVNHCEWRSDIIILLSNTTPSIIATTNDFYVRANGLKEQLFSARKKGLDSMEYEDALNSVLKALYDLIGKPVIQRLQELNVPEQSRVWWRPTSVFCSLPLHAMGPIRLDGPLKLYFSDLYIPSYTTTLSALIDSRKPGTHSFEKPSILLVAQPDEFMPGAWDEISLIRRLETTVTTLASKRATPSTVMKCLQDHRFAHFSCHGILETGRPFDASFKLFQGQRLTVLEIIRSRLPAAEFAFLSACHTAELTEESITDEGLHLSAAVQHAGFRSVVGTTWAMADIDGHDLAKNFYRSLFSDKWQGVPYYERTAEALRDAVRELRRKKNMSTERWVNFVHYGA